MRKEAPNTGVFVSKALAKKVKTLASDRGRGQGEVVDAFVRRLVESVERGDRLQVIVPEYKKETRNDTRMVLVRKDMQRRLKILAVHHDTTTRALVRLALEEGIEVETARPGSVLVPAVKVAVSTKAVHCDAQLVDALKAIAQARGTTVVGLTDAVLRVVVQSPEVLDSIELPPAREVPASIAVDEAARRAVELASNGPRMPSGGGSKPRRDGGRKRASAR